MSLDPRLLPPTVPTKKTRPAPASYLPTTVAIPAQSSRVLPVIDRGPATGRLPSISSWTQLLRARGTGWSRGLGGSSCNGRVGLPPSTFRVCRLTFCYSFF
ncbi:hypothetical protein IF2G_09418 [Cordyceps javanica]|nr:hypothetical protein IF2G_09418 [Cordyceps javanica]